MAIVVMLSDGTLSRENGAITTGSRILRKGLKGLGKGASALWNGRIQHLPMFDFLCLSAFEHIMV